MESYFLLFLLVFIISLILLTDCSGQENFEASFEKAAGKMTDDPSVPSLIPHIAADGTVRKVQGGFSNPGKAANKLSEIDANLQKLVSYIKNKFPSHAVTQNLAKRYNGQNIFEGVPNNEQSLTSYTTNKEVMGFCLRKKNTPSNVYNDLNLIMFVAIHELAHMGSFTIGHGSEFWRNFRWLLERAIEIGIYRAVNYSVRPVEYCGLKVDYNPLFS